MDKDENQRQLKKTTNCVYSTVVDCNSTLVEPGFRKAEKLEKLSGVNQAHGFSLEFYGFLRSFMS